MPTVAKGNYIKGKGGIKHALSHVRYLQLRGGDDRDHAIGRKRLFINAKREGISGSEVIEQIKRQNEKGNVVHRIVLSPGVENVDMETYTREVMSDLGRSKGQDLIWFATEHKNTDHNHTHVVLMGRDKYGKPVTLNRNNYKTVRETGDRYIERFHPFERYLDRDLPNLMRDGYKHDRGDQYYEWLIEDLGSPNSLQECNEKRTAELASLAAESEKHAVPDSERIVCDNVIYTKYSSLDDLLELDRKLASGELAPIPKEQYQEMWSWIGKKKQFGDDYYVRAAEADRMQKQFDEHLQRAYGTDNSPRKSFNQYVFESKGRLLVWHEHYEINTQRLELEKKIEELEQNGSDDQKLLDGLRDQLDWVNSLSQERFEPEIKVSDVAQSKPHEKEFEQPAPHLDSGAHIDVNNERVTSEQPEEEGVKEAHGQEQQFHSCISALLFGDEPAPKMPAYEKSQEELGMEDWDKNAFEFFSTRTDDERSNSLDDVDDQTHIADQQMSRSRQEDIALDEIMQSQVQQNLLQQIRQTFEPDHQHLEGKTEIEQTRENKEQDRLDDDVGRERGR